MVEFAHSFREELSLQEREYLRRAVVILTDQYFDDLNALAEGEDFSETSMWSDLPSTHLTRYSLGFARAFFTSLISVGWNLAQAEWRPLSCLAEELALNAIVEEAEGLMDGDGLPYDFNAFRDSAFADEDYQYLFDPAEDGIADSAVAHDMGMANLRFEEWFRPFYGGDGVGVHPYSAEDASPSRGT